VTPWLAREREREPGGKRVRITEEGLTDRQMPHCSSLFALPILQNKDRVAHPSCTLFRCAEPSQRRLLTALPKAAGLVQWDKWFIWLPLFLLLFFICHFLPKNRMSSPKTT
jgi:hypothetical protein